MLNCWSYLFTSHVFSSITKFFSQDLNLGWIIVILHSAFQIHWFSIFNSFMMVIFLVGLVSMILMRTLRKDYARYSKEDDLDDMVRFFYGLKSLFVLLLLFALWSTSMWNISVTILFQIIPWVVDITILTYYLYGNVPLLWLGDCKWLVFAITVGMIYA